MTERMWEKVTVTLNTLGSDKIDLAVYYLDEAGAMGTEVAYAQGYLENHPDLFGEIPQALPDEYLTHPVEVIGYFEQGIITNIESFLLPLNEHIIRIHTEEIPDENWQSNWMQYYKPQRISRFLTIVPEWERQYKSSVNEQVIFMDPGVAFGTGSHPTTRLGAQALELVMRGGERVIDVGTGTGILSFIAATFGAQEILGTDLDPQAVAAAETNLQSQMQNLTIKKLVDEEAIHFQESNLLVGVNFEADIIVANILPHILVNLFDDARRLLTKDGYLILGGILSEKAPFIETALTTADWKIYLKSEMSGWVNYIVVKGEVN